MYCYQVHGLASYIGFLGSPGLDPHKGVPNTLSVLAAFPEQAFSATSPTGAWWWKSCSMQLSSNPTRTSFS